MAKVMGYAAIVLVIIYQTTTCIATSVLFNAKTDQASLLSFKNHLISNPSNSYMNQLSRNWSMDASVCSWMGVYCGTRHRRVVALNLTNLGLGGTIAPHLGNLTFLRSLDLSENNLTGIMPNELKKLQRLNYLNVGFNMLSGEIPPWFGSLKKLEHLHLQNNNFFGPIPDSFENFKAIKTIVLRSNHLIGSLPSGMFNISSLQDIDLSYNNLSGNLPIQMCGGNGYSRLTKLILPFNQFSGKIPSTLQVCRNLKVLQLSNNQFTGSIPAEIGNLTMLEDLHLSFNTLEGELPPELGNLKLQIFSVTACNLSARVPHTIFNMSSLVVLALAINTFSGQLPPTLGIGLPNLKVISLSDNSLSGMIPASLANASALVHMHMMYNLFHGPIPTTIGNLRHLKGLLLGGNDLTGDAPNQELRFLSSLTNCRYIQRAELSLNQLNGILPSSIGNFSDSLRYLGAFSSKLKGKIPSEIANLRGLHSIDLDSNELTGNIPWALGNMKQLDRIYLEHNRLEGQVPASFCQLNNLWDLYLSDNLLCGPIPTCLAEIKSLRRIYIDSNKFNSSVPMNLWSLSDLVGLNLSSNLLTGSLPDSIKEMEHINELGLSHNQLSGNISSSISSFQSLTYLSLSHNNFQGVIPQSLKKLLSLEFLDLSFNNLSGRIPKSLEELKFLQYFNVSFNRLEGEIPTGGQFYNFTYLSYIHNDALCGEVLQIPQCKTRSHRSLLKYILPSLLSSAILVSLVVFLFLKSRKGTTTTQQVPDQLPSTWRGISYQELLRATDTFSDTNLLGRGSFGTVYKGKLSDGQDVAVKVFHLEYEGGIRSFFSECEVLRNIRHRNLVKVISCCSNIDFKALVLEFMPNESLDKWLHSPNRFLNMNQRLSIALDVSEALEYIHHDHITPIIHRDIKPSNIVLDEDMVAYVCDFGMAKLFAEGESIARTETLATIGYIAPEYATEGIVSTSGDVYSYGTILLEMFTGKKPTDEMFGEEMSLFDWVSSAHGDAILDLVDIKLFEEENIIEFPTKKQSLTLIFDLAKDCMRSKPQERITMREVVARLEKIKLIFEAAT